MNDASRQSVIASYLKSLEESAKETMKKGHTLSAAYMASICGMWTNYFKRPYVNPFNDDIWLYRWFSNGYDDYTQAIGLTMQIRKKQLEKEVEEKRPAKKKL